VSDRIKALTVVLDDDYRDDSLDALVTAIRLFKGVADVKTHKVTSDDVIARMKIKRELVDKLWDALKDED